jgi:hypothetical protein
MQMHFCSLVSIAEQGHREHEHSVQCMLMKLSSSGHIVLVCYMGSILQAYPVLVALWWCGVSLLSMQWHACRQVARALAAAPPLRGLMAVISHAGLQYNTTGCSAELRSLKRQGDGSLHVLALGRQRVSVDLAALAAGEACRLHLPASYACSRGAH